jgi:hypothetical protein
MDYEYKYLKYKAKYLNLKNKENLLLGGRRNIFDKIKIVTKFNSGLQGETYLIKINKKNFILKRQKITDDEYTNNTLNSQIYREIQFYKWINKLGKNKIFFMKMVSYRKISCTEDIVLKNNFISEEQKKSKYCLELILDKKDYILSNNINLLTDVDLFYGFIQCLNILNLMHTSGWIHADTKADNIAFNNLYNKTDITIKNFGKINTSYIFSLIDYGSVLNHNFLYDDENLNKFTKVNIDYDLYFLIEYFLLNNYDLYDKINNWQHKTNNMYNIIKLIDTNIFESVMSMLKDFYYNVNLKILNDKNDIFFRILGWEFLQILQIKHNEYFYKIINEYYKINIKPTHITELEIIFNIKKNYYDYQKIFEILKIYIPIKIHLKIDNTAIVK